MEQKAINSSIWTTKTAKEEIEIKYPPKKKQRLSSGNVNDGVHEISTAFKTRTTNTIKEWSDYFSFFWSSYNLVYLKCI